MREHFEINGVDLNRCKLLEAAVTDRDGTVGFHTGRPDEWYGQALGGATPVRAVSLKTILAPYDSVDLIDMDVQGAEYMVLAAASRDLHDKVKRVHIGTHNP